jgi:hypothetical protein
VSIQVILKNDGGGSGIKAILSLLPIALPKSQAALGLAAGQTLVLAHNRHRHTCGKRVDKCNSVRGLGRRSAVKASRYADDDLGHTVVLSCKTRHLDQYPLDYDLFGLLILDREGLQGSSEGPRRVADGQPNPASAEVNCEHSHSCLICRC